MPIDLSALEAGARYAGDYDADLVTLQRRLAHAQTACRAYRRRVAIVLEGLEPAGHGGLIQRMAARWDHRYARIWPIAAPNEEERAHHFLRRFWARLPAAGQIAVFDRSWYGRVLADRVDRTASEQAWRRAYDEINEFESQQVSDGVILIKLWLHVRAEVADDRLRARIAHPWKGWEITADDLRDHDRRDACDRAVADVFAQTDTRWARWTAVDANNKKTARIAVLAHVAERLEAALPTAPPVPTDELRSVAAALGTTLD